METPNKLMTWDEMKKKYPGKWVFVDQTKGDGSNIEEGVVKYVATDDEMEDVWVQCMKQDLDYAMARTTVEPFMGVVDGINFSIDVQEIFKDEN